MKPLRSDADLPGVFGPVLERLRQEPPAAFGLPEVRLRPVAFQARPFSNVVRIAICPPSGDPTGFCFAKILTPKAIPDGEEHMRRRVRHEFETTTMVEDALRGRSGIDTLHPIACYPDLFAIVTKELRGVTLLQYLQPRLTWLAGTRSRGEAAQTMGLVGSWLRAFQQIAPGHDLVEVTDLRDYVDVRLARLVSSGRSPITSPVRQRVLQHIESLGGAIAPEERRSVLLHADLAPGNVMVTRQGVAVLDFAMASRGTYLHDITRLAVQIDLLRGKPQFRPSAVRSAVSALLQAFGPTVSPGHPLFRLLTLLHRVNHLATLTLADAGGATRLYNWRLRRMHERWIARELATPVGAATFAERRRASL